MVDETRYCCCWCRLHLIGSRGSHSPSVHHYHKPHTLSMSSWLGRSCSCALWILPFHVDVWVGGPSWRQAYPSPWWYAFLPWFRAGNAPRSSPNWRPSSRLSLWHWQWWDRDRPLQQQRPSGLLMLALARCRSLQATCPSHDEDMRVCTLGVSPKLPGWIPSPYAGNLKFFLARRLFCLAGRTWRGMPWNICPMCW